MDEDLEEKLREETEKWLKKIKTEDIRSMEGEDKVVKNIRAYIEDSQHFLEEGELIEAFEAVIWAWSWYEIGHEMGLLDEG